MTEEVLEGKHGPQGLRTVSNTTENKEVYEYIGYELSMARGPGCRQLPALLCDLSGSGDVARTISSTSGVQKRCVSLAYVALCQAHSMVSDEVILAS